MLCSKKLITLTIVLLLFVTVVVSPVKADQESAAAAISSAKNTITTCYTAAKEAEASGANITALVVTLNEAGALLSQAELAYAAKDFDASLSLAVQSQNSLNNFVEEANDLKETALQQQNQDFLINVVGSIISTFVVMFVGGLGWLLLKRKFETVEADVVESEGV